MITVYEHHLHLYGCLTAEEVWRLGRDCWKNRQQALVHYAKNYQRQFGVYPDYQSFWRDDDGLEKLRQCYQVDASLTFAQFQAKFDLLIALFPLVGVEWLSVWRRVLDRHRDSGIYYAEYRFIFPRNKPLFYLTKIDRLLIEYANATGGTFEPRLAVSLSRQPQLASQQYRALRGWLDSGQLSYLSAVDFCGFEEQFPPCLYRQLWQEIRSDNLSRRRRLAILVHVGECYRGLGLASAIRRVIEAHLLGAHRLGHAIAAGIDIENFRGQRLEVDVNEENYHRRWLKDNARLLADYGYRVDRSLVANGEYNDETCLDLVQFQRAVLTWLAERRAIVEVCPTSNFYLGEIKKKTFHPLINFVRYQLLLTIASDDPGIFASDWWQELELARQLVADSKFIERVIDNGERFCSQSLA